MRAVVHPTKASAEAQIAELNAARGYPKIEPGIRYGGGIFADSITTTSECAPVELKSGGWGVPADALERGGFETKTAIDVEAKGDR